MLWKLQNPSAPVPTTPEPTTSVPTTTTSVPEPTTTISAPEPTTTISVPEPTTTTSAPATTTTPCKLSEWSKWSSCIDNKQTRKRNVISGNCNEPLLETQDCSNCEVSLWTLSDVCEDDALRLKTRTIIKPPVGDVDKCPNLTEKIPCYEDCKVSEWSKPTPCDRDIGGFQTRTREILQKRIGLGKECPPTTEKIPCSLDCEMSEWSEWSECDNNGEQFRTRTMLKPSVHAGRCPTVINERGEESPDLRETRNCPVDCVVSEWSPFTDCTKTCGGGIKTRRRTVLVSDKYGGKVCPPLIQNEICNTEKCNVEPVQYVAMSSSQYNTVYTYDGISWNGLGNTIFNSKGNSAIYGKDKWVAVGRSTSYGFGNIAYSYDGKSWTVIDKVKSIIQGHGTDIAYGNGNWIIVGNENMAISPDTTMSDPSSWKKIVQTQLKSFKCIVYANNKWFIGGESYFSNSLLYCNDNDLSNWINISPYSSNATESVSTNAIAYGRYGIWVCVNSSSNSTISYSNNNGISWNGLGKTIFSIEGKSVCYGNEIWVAVGSGTNNVAYSSDGVNWTGNGYTMFGQDYLMNSVSYGGGGVFLFGTNKDNNCFGITYNKGKTWILYGNGLISVNKIVSSMYLPKCNLISDDQENCESVKCSYDDEWKNIGECSKPCEGGKQTLIKNVKTTPLYGQDDCKYSILDQTDCNQQPCPINCEVSEWENDGTCDDPCDGRPQKQIRKILKEAQYGGYCPELTREISCDCSVKQLKGGNSYQNTVFNSVDGLNWTGLGKTIFSNYCEKICYGNNMWFLLGSHNIPNLKTRYSSDGLNYVWNSYIDGIYNRIYNINFINDYFIAIGEPSKTFINDNKISGTIDKNGNFINTYRTPNQNISSIISFSKDCLVWEYISSTTIYIFSISYGNKLWVICGNGENSLMYSTDRKQWEKCLNRENDVPISNSINFIKSVVYGNCLFVAIGDSNILYSATGRKWKILNTSIEPENISFGNNVFVIVGKNNKITTSSDGNNWSQIVFNNLSRNLFFDKDKFYIIRDNIIKSSTDGKIWINNFDDDNILSICSKVKNSVDTCSEPINIDCKLSEWVDNSDCSNPCDGGTKTQIRTVLTYPENDGKICPTDLTKTVECNTEKCKLTCEKDGYILDSNGNCVCASGWLGNVSYNTEPSLNKQPNGCSKCEIGKYNPGINQTKCIDCPRGTYNDVEGSAICKPCPSGTYNLTTGNKSIDSCIPSEAGTYIYTGAEYPFPLSCPINTYSGKGATTCTPCDDGYLTLDEGSIECIKKNTEVKMTGDTTINSYYQFLIKATPSLPIVFNTIKIKFSNITGATNSQFISNYKPVIQQIKIYNSSDTQNSVRGINIISPPIIEHNKIVYTLVPYTVPTAIDTNQYLELLFYFSSLQGFTFDNKIYYEITLNNCDNLVCPVIPVDCEVSEWSDWTTCSAPCGNGTQSRMRNILTPAYNGGKCDIQLTENRDCIIKNCPIDCKYTVSDWGDCSATCGGGTASRNITIEQEPLYGGIECPVIQLNTTCHDSVCINYDYISEYESKYSTYISNSNLYTENIQISSTLPSNIYLKGIDIQFSESKNMNLIKSYSIYSSGLQLKTGESTSWEEKTKGLYVSQPSNKTYIIYRKNNNIVKINNGSQLYLSLTFSGFNNQYLQVLFNYKVTLFYDVDTDCVLSPITWSDCSATCGGGTRTGTQTIVSQAKYNGMSCPTNLTITEQCNINMCPISTNKPIPDITFSNISYPYYLSNIFAGNPMNFNTNFYSSYTLSGFKNTVSLTFNTKQDNRININSMSFFTDCKSVEYPKQFNKDIYCYIVGIKFTEYGSNNVSTMVYDSTINNFVFAQNDNILNSTDTSYFNKINNILISSKQYESSGNTLVSKLIKLSNLNVNYVRSIEFIYNLYTENTFTTRSTLSFDINITEIIASPTDCLLSNWGNWGDCSVPCGNGTQTRTKNILQNSLFGGQPCTNFIMSENQNCNNGVCVPVNCTLSSWSNWSDCSKSCGGGIQTRTRTILSESKYGGTCDSLLDTQNCNTNVCVVSWIIGGNKFSANKISYSFDGYIWTGLGNTYFISCTCIKYANNKWYVGGIKTKYAVSFGEVTTIIGNNMYNSIDGINWNICILPNNLNLYNITTICNGNNKILAIGTSTSGYDDTIINCYILNSIDGTTFTNANPTISGLISNLNSRGNIINSMDFYNNLFVMVGGGVYWNSFGCIYSSTDGQNWVLRTSPEYKLNKVKYIYEDNIWITVGSGNSTQNPILSSSDGQIWTQINTQNLFNEAFAIEYLKISDIDQYFIGVFSKTKGIEPSNTNTINNKKWSMSFVNNFYRYISINKIQKLFIGIYFDSNASSNIFLYDYGKIKTQNINYTNISCIETNNL